MKTGEWRPVAGGRSFGPLGPKGRPPDPLGSSVLLVIPRPAADIARPVADIARPEADIARPSAHQPKGQPRFFATFLEIHTWEHLFMISAVTIINGYSHGILEMETVIFHNFHDFY